MTSTAPGGGGDDTAARSSSGFPYLSIFTLCICSFASAINQTMMPPIAPFYIFDSGMVSDPREPGVYAGYLSASGQVGRLFSSLPWGRFSDTHGRKTVVQVGLASTMVTSLLFGLTLNFYVGCALRFANGACDFLFGIVKVRKTPSWPRSWADFSPL
jgi:MFS family permease